MENKDFENSIHNLLQEKIEVLENNVKKRFSFEEIIARALIQKALSGNVRAFREVINFYNKSPRSKEFVLITDIEDAYL